MCRRCATAILLSQVLIFVGGLLTVAIADDDAARGPSAPVEMNELEKGFADSLKGAELVGYSARDDKDVGKLTPDRYVIDDIVKVDATHWRIKAGMKVGELPVVLPLLVEVQWAGDTPVLTLTDFSVGPLGTFTARVLFYRGRYAGTWSHGAKHGGNKVGGQIYGQIVRKTAKPAKKHDATKPAAKSDSKPKPAE